MKNVFLEEIQTALGPAFTSTASIDIGGEAELPSCYRVTDLAVASIQVVAMELADFLEASHVSLNQRLAALWFDMTLRPIDWELPSAWDPIAGAYQTEDGWIRLHTNAPHHREAVLRVLSCHSQREEVKAEVAKWRKTELETQIVEQGGAAAAMLTADEWALHPQGRAVAQDPLIAWQKKGETAQKSCLEGLRILDLTRVLAGPVATRCLAGFGARVLRIDPPWWSEPGVEPEVTLGKRRAGLDLRQADHKEIFETLLRTTDVLVHGYRPGALDALGYSTERLAQLAPDMIDVSLCAYGWSGPWAKRRGFDSLVQMSCGIAAEGMRRKGAAGPVPLPVQALDHATGYLMAASILRALRLRNRAGEVFSARLSLARTAHLLASRGSRAFRGQAIQETGQDCNPSIEQTSWGPAKRLHFPFKINGAGPIWPYPAGKLGIDAATWT